MTLAEYLAEVKKRADAATRGPWVYGMPTAGFLENDENNFVFCSHARTDVPLLLAIIEEQAKALEEYTSIKYGRAINAKTRDALARIDALIAKGEKK